MKYENNKSIIMNKIIIYKIIITYKNIENNIIRKLIIH